MADHNKRKSVLQERSVAQDVGGKLQPGSGAPQFYKGDVRKAGDLRVECKTTGSKAFSLKLGEIEKIKGEALMGGAEGWAMQVEFSGQPTKKKFAVIDWQEYLDLRAAAREPNPIVRGNPALGALRDEMMMAEARASVALDHGEIGTRCAEDDE